MSPWLNELLEINRREKQVINDPFFRFSLTEQEWYDYMLNLFSTPETNEYKREYFRMVYNNVHPDTITEHMFKHNMARAIKQNSKKT